MTSTSPQATSPQATAPQPTAPQTRDRPVTGEPAVDETLAELAGLAAAPLAEHHDRLARAHERLHQTLHGDGSDA